MTDYSAEEAFERYGDMVLRLAVARTGSRSEGEDVLQEVFVRYIKNGKNFASEEHRKAWILRVTINCAKSFSVSAWKRRHVLTADISFPPEVTRDQSRVYEAVMTLPAKYRTAVHLFYYEELSAREIAELMGCAEGTVRSLLSRAREKLGTILKGVEWDVSRGL